jgi:peptide deformylase
MIYPVLIYGNQILRKKATDITKDYEGLSQLISDMWETMYNADGVGLAAPQLGISIRLIVIDGKDLSDDYPELLNFKKVFINAEIVEEEGSDAQQEGCLSLPNIREDVTRPYRIRIKYFDEHFNFHDETYNGQKARIIQHEYDHLEGRLFTDYLSPLRRRLIKGKLNAITQGKVKTNYKIRL